MPDAPDEIFQFPCPFPVKVIGHAGEMFIPTILSILEGVVGPIGKEAVVSRLSREGKYLSMTVTIIAESREQLELVNQEIRKHHDVIMVL